MTDQESTPAEGSTPDAPETEAKTEGKTFDEAYVKELRAEAAKWRTKAQQSSEEAEELKERDKTEAEKLAGKLAKLEREKAEAESALTRFQVAAEKQIPADAMDLLTGSTREELEAKADKLLTLVKSRPETDKAPDFDGGPREPTTEPDTPQDAHDKAILALLGLAPNNT